MTNIAQAADPETKPAATNDALSLRYVPRDAVAVAGVRPSALLSYPEFQELFRDLLEQTPVASDQVSEVTGVFLIEGGPGAPLQSGSVVVVVHFKGEGQAKTVLEKLLPNATASTFDGRPMYVNGKGAGSLPDDHTIIFGQSEGIVRRLMVAGAEGSPSTEIANGWKLVSRHDVSLAINVASMAALMPANAPVPPSAAMFSPLWQKTKSAVAGISLKENLAINGFINSATEGDAKEVLGTLTALVTLSKNMLSGGRAMAAERPAEESAVLLRSIDVAEDVLDKMQVQQNGSTVTLSTKADASQTRKLIGTLLPAIRSAREKALRSQDRNNMSQIMVALYNYRDAHGRFPPSVVVGPDGETVHSWRVAILPYIDAGLYSQYKLDEPWDSESNLAVLRQIPSIYRSPLDPPTTINTSYFGLVGKHTFFGNEQGIFAEDAVDGLSNTMAILSTERDIPWTKPEDIAYEEEAPVSELKSRFEDTFQFGMGDGSIRGFPPSIPQAALRAWITIDGGEVTSDF